MSKHDKHLFPGRDDVRNFVYVYRRREQPEPKRNRRAIHRTILRRQARQFKAANT
jgi:hypothetical protein